MSFLNFKNNIRGRNETFPPRKPSLGEGSSEPLHPLIDLEENDDDVIESSPMDFAKVYIPFFILNWFLLLILSRAQFIHNWLYKKF